MRWNRSANQFEEWGSGAWNPKILSIAGGGTGSNNPTGIRAALGLGTMSTQNANAVAITGGTLSGVAFSGAIGFSGGSISLTSGGIAVNANGAVSALTLTGYPGVWTQILTAGGAPSYGLLCRAGTGNAGEMSFQVQNQAGSTNGFYVNGAMTVVCPTRLVIPVGANFWA